MQNKRVSIFVIIGISIISILSISILIQSLFTYENTKEKLSNEIIYNSNVSIRQLKKVLVHYIESYDINEYEKFIESEMGYKDIYAIVVEDFNMGKILGKKRYVVGKIRDKNWNIVPYKQNNENGLKDTIYSKKSDIIDNKGIKIGTVSIYSTDKFMKQELENIISRNLILTLTISVITTILLFYVIYILILKPISTMVESISQTDDDGIPINGIKLYKKSSKEIANLVDTINKMLFKIKNSTKELEELNKRFSLTFDGINDGIWDWNLQTNKVYYSKKWKSMLGYKDEEIDDSPKAFFEMLSEEDQIRIDKALKNHFDNPSNNPYSLEIRIRCKDGNYKWILTRGKAILDENNTAVRVLGSHTDITEKKEAEERLKEQNVEFQTIFNNSKDGIAIFDLNTNFLNFNDAYLDITGYTKEELSTKSCIELTAPEDKESAKEIVEIVKKEGFIENFEKTCIGKDGKRVSSIMSIVLLPDKKRMLATTKDMTQMKLLESQSKLASMGEMIGNIAHQWRQPLSVITTSISSLQIKKDLEKEIKDEDIDEVTEAIIKQSKYLSKTIDDFRDFIKGDKHYQNISIKEVIDESLNLAKSSIVNNYINLIYNVEDDLVIKGNKSELEQALINLINNAKDALKEHVLLDDDKFIFIESKKLNNTTIEVKLKDTAGGIPENIKERILEPYFTTKHKSQGTGLGLSMADKIIRERHNATFNISNEKFEYNNKTYKGACFTITFKV